jgi:catechol 2,3-dioxygenase-like lactoylglutathione lyase family enzyme
VIDVQRVDYIRVPVTDMEKANYFYGEVLGLERNPNSPGEDWVEYETDNVTLAVMTPHTHGYEFTPLPPGTIALRVPDVAEAKTKLEAAGVQVNDMWDSGVCRGAGVRDPTATPSCSTTATSRTSRPDARAAYRDRRLSERRYQPEAWICGKGSDLRNTQPTRFGSAPPHPGTGLCRGHCLHQSFDRRWSLRRTALLAVGSVVAGSIRGNEEKERDARTPRSVPNYAVGTAACPGARAVEGRMPRNPLSTAIYANRTICEMSA